MAITLRLRGQIFEWDAEEAASNLRKHGVTFQEACEGERSRLLFVVHVVREEEAIRIISARPATAEERKSYERE